MFNPYPPRAQAPTPEAKDSDADDTGRFAPAQPGAKTAASSAVGMPGPRPTTGRGPTTTATTQPVPKNSPTATTTQPVPKDSPAATATQPVPKDSPAPTTRPDAPTASQPIVNAAIAAEGEPPRPSTEPRARAGAPVLPFSFLRPAAAPARAAAAEEPPKDGDPPRKKP